MDESVDVEDIEKIVDIECEEAEQRVKQEQDVAENKEEDGSGKLSNLISSFFHHDEEGAGQAPEKEVPGSAEKPEKETDNGSSLVDNLTSSFFHHDEEGAAQAPEKEIPASAEKPEKETDKGSSLVDNLIAKLPSPLSDEAAPETEEASILIHSIVHD